jgi:hypothetical protein
MVERGPFLEQEGGSTAYVVDGDNAVRQPIQAGASQPGQRGNRLGAQAGDRIASRAPISSTTRTASASRETNAMNAFVALPDAFN